MYHPHRLQGVLCNKILEMNKTYNNFLGLECCQYPALSLLNPKKVDVFKAKHKEITAEDDLLDALMISHFAALRNCWDLCLMSELPQSKKLNKGKIYLEKQGNKLKYVLLSSREDSVIEGELDIRVRGGLTKEFLNEQKSEIVEIISKRGHTRTDHIIDKIIHRNKENSLFKYLETSDREAIIACCGSYRAHLCSHP